MSIHDRNAIPVSRRHFLIGASLTGAGLVIGFKPTASSAAAPDAFEAGAFIRIPAEGKIVFVISPVEMGQGIYTAVAMLLAVAATWIQPEIVNHGWILIAIAAGFLVGVPLSRVPLTAVPQRTAAGGGTGCRLGRRHWPFWTLISVMSGSYSDLSNNVMEMKSETNRSEPRNTSVLNGRSQRKCMK